MEFFKNKIISYMKSKNISYSQLSKLTGITKSSLQRYATGTTLKVPVDAIAKIETALEIPKGTLLGWNNDSYTVEHEDLATIRLSKKEEALIIKYREKPQMQEAIDKLLGI